MERRHPYSTGYRTGCTKVNNGNWIDLLEALQIKKTEITMEVGGWIHFSQGKKLENRPRIDFNKIG